MDYIKLYETQAAYEADATIARMKSGDFILPNVSYTVDTQKVFYNPLKTFQDAADIYITNGSTSKIVNNSVYFAKYLNDPAWTPIGIVVIPSDFMEDGKARVMSLVDMDYETPETGNLTTNKKMYWGDSGMDIAELTNLDKVITGDSETTTFGTNSSASLPDEAGSYYSTPHAPSPYTAEGGKNAPYFYKEIIDGVDFSKNALADLDGVGNTDIIVGKATAQSDWQTAATITNNDGAGYYPAACCTRRFHTEGTDAGDWYLPACGELGFVYPKFTSINTALNQLKNNSKVAVPVLSHNYWSSSECSTGTNRRVGMNNGGVYDSYKLSNGYVRAFLRV